jgi:prepilin-type N-terminal cleavage/methylation domain-containing protein
MKKQNLLHHQEGFTLVEIIAVLIILGILAAVIVPGYIDSVASSKRRGLEVAVAELNLRECRVWAETKKSNSDTATAVMTSIAHTDPNSHLYLGKDYTWGGNPGGGNAVLDFQGQTANVTRTPETDTTPAVWTLEHIN